MKILKIWPFSAKKWPLIQSGALKTRVAINIGIETVNFDEAKQNVL